MFRRRNVLLVLLIGAMVALHQDFWFWNDSRLVLGFIPVGLAYHAFYSVLCAVTLAILVKTAWPEHLEDVQAEPGANGPLVDPSKGGGRPRIDARPTRNSPSGGGGNH